MDAETLSFIEFISDKEQTDVNMLKKSLHITRSQILYRLEKTNDLLLAKKVDPIELTNKNTLIVPQPVRLFLNQEVISSFNGKNYYLSSEERVVYLFMILFTKKEADYFTTDYFCTELQVSRTTVFKDLKELNRFLDSREIRLGNTRENGYFLAGTELSLRRAMMDCVALILTENPQSKVFDILMSSLNLYDYSKAKAMIEKLAKRYKIRFVENRLMEFIYIFVFLTTRLNCLEENLIDTPQTFALMATFKEYHFVLELMKNIQFVQAISEQELMYITSWILGISFGDINENTGDCILISDLVGQMMTRFISLAGIHYEDPEPIFKKLYAHFRPAYYRLLFHLPIYNPLTERIKEEYKTIFTLVEETMMPFKHLFGYDIPEEEIAYLTTHFVSIFDTTTEEIMSGKDLLKDMTKALVVCTNGIGSSVILYNELKEMFPDFYFFEPVNLEEAPPLLQNADIVFTTNNLFHLENPKGAPIIRVKPVMTTEERYQVIREVHLNLGIMQGMVSINDLLAIIAQSASISKPDRLKEDLVSYFIHHEVDHNKSSSHDLHLEEMLQKELIQLGVQARNWEAAIRLSYQPLVDHKKILQNYVEKTIQSVRLMGPYIVIGRHIALPHSKVEDGALENALGLTVLSQPVNFGDTYNDPVKYIFSLSAVNNKDHITAMSELMELLNQPAFFTMLDQAQTSDEILQFIRSIDH